MNYYFATQSFLKKKYQTVSQKLYDDELNSFDF